LLLRITQGMAQFVVVYHSEGGAVCYVLFRGWRCLLLRITRGMAQFVVVYHSEGGAVCCYVLFRGWRCLFLCITQRMAQFIVANASRIRFTSRLLTCFPLE